MSDETPKPKPPTDSEAPAKPEPPKAEPTKPSPEAASAAPGTAPAAPKPAAAKPAAKPAAASKVPTAPTGPPDPAAPDDVAPPGYVAALQAAHPDAIEQLSYHVGDWTAVVRVPHLLEVCEFLRDAEETTFDFCSDLTASDWPARTARFDVVYCLYSTRHRHRLRLKVRAADGDPVPSVSGIWPAANWLEREVYDLFGVTFAGHPDLRRILMPEEWQGHPQRKDYPLEGPGELLMESPLDWLRLRNARVETEIE